MILYSYLLLVFSSLSAAGIVLPPSDCRDRYFRSGCAHCMACRICLLLGLLYRQFQLFETGQRHGLVVLRRIQLRCERRARFVGFVSK